MLGGFIVGFIEATTIVQHGDIHEFHEMLSEKINILQNEDDLEVEVHYSTSMTDNQILYTALLIGKTYL